MQTCALFRVKKQPCKGRKKGLCQKIRKKKPTNVFFLSVFMKSAFRSRSEERVKKKHYKILFLPSITFFFGGKTSAA